MGLRSTPLFLLLLLLCFFSSFSHGHGISGVLDEREFGGVVEWNVRRVVAEISTNSTHLILAANRTHRRDPINGFKYYTGGWNITDPHYLYSLGYSATPPIFIALIWFLVFGICLCCICLRRCCCCCPRKVPYGYSRIAYALSLCFLVLSTLAAITGSYILYAGEAKFQMSTVKITSYLLHEADMIVMNLKNLLNSLLSAKKIGVGELSLPKEFQNSIDQIGINITTVADMFHNITGKKTDDIWRFLDPMRVYLLCITLAMMILAFLGFLLSLLGIQCVLYLFMIIGWILVVATLIVSSMFLLVHNAVTDTCVAMDEWLQNPNANSAIEDILPKVDNETAQVILQVTKGITFGLVNVVNGAISNISNNNIPPDAGPPLYYNQSGPLMPLLCNPYNFNLSDRKCANGEVDLKNATEVWRNYICEVSSSGICETRGRLTPDRYTQTTASVNVSYGLHNESLFLIKVIDSTFLKRTFSNISKNYCPSLSQYSKLTYAGFIVASTGIMLSLILWVVYGRQRRHRAYTRKRIKKPLKGHFDNDNVPFNYHSSNFSD